MSNNRLELAKNLNIPRAERARPFVEESHGRIFSKAEIHALLMRFAEAEDSFAASETSALTTRLEAVEGENRCDVCDGAGTPINGKPCMCGGTGKMSDGVTYLRRELFDVEKENAELRAEVERLRGFPIKNEYPNSDGGKCPLCGHGCSRVEYEKAVEIECNDCTFNCLEEDLVDDTTKQGNTL